VSPGGISRAGPDGGHLPAGGAAQDPEPTTALERRYRRLLRCGASRHLGGGIPVLAARPRAPARGARGGDDRLAGCGAAGADRPAADRRGGRVHPAGAGPGGPADRGQAADQCLVRRASPVRMDGRPGALPSWPAWPLARWPSRPARGGAWPSRGDGEPA